MVDSPQVLLKTMFDAAIRAALPEKIVPRHLPAPPKGRTIVVGAGKASAAMARAVEDHWPGPIAGLVITRYGHAVPCRRIEIVEAAHPVPDAAGHAAAQRILELAKGAGPDDLVLCLISGGGSALLALPAPGLTLEDGSVEKLGVPAVRGSRSAAPASTANSVPASASCSRPSIPPQS
jgi:glycerate 2-kinase